MKKIKNIFKTYYLTCAGAIVISFALLAPVLVGSVGMGLDFAQAYLVKERLAHALDSAALAASAAAADGSNLEQKLQAFFEANYPPESIGTAYDLHIEVVGDEVKVSAKADYKTSFLRVLGYDSITVGAKTVVKRQVRGLEVALVLDVTGSMQGSKITSLRTASKNFIEILFGRVEDPQFLKIGMVPYAITVNVGDVAPDIVDLPVVPGRPGVVYDPNNPEMWAGCVMAREAPYNESDADMLDGGYWKAYWWEHEPNKNNWDPNQGGSINLKYPISDNASCNDRRSPNLGCPIENPIIPLTSDEGVLLSAAEKITHWCRGGTAGNLGLVWGWRLLSKTEPFEEGASYTNPYWRKAVVMMTDGENTFYQGDYSAYQYIAQGKMKTTQGVDPGRYGYNPTPGQSITNKNNATKEINNRFIRTCKAMKEAGIIIYTVTFGSSIIGTPTELFYKDCASDLTKYYPAATNEELIDAFEKISEQLSNLHISG